VSRVEELAPLALLVALLAAAVAVSLLSRRSDMPASVVFVLIGLGVSLLGLGVAVPVSPALLLAIVLPGLVFEAAFRTEVSILRPAAAAVLLLAVPGVLVVALIVAVVLSATTGLSLGEAFLVGAMVAATDAAAVLSTFRHLHVPPRLATTVEMESLVNDGTGIVLFAVAIDVLAGRASLDGAVVAFVASVIASCVVGAALGWLAARVIDRVNDHVIELTITVVLAYGTYLIATIAGFSGVIATLVAAGVFGARSRGRMTERSAESVDVVWELIAFVLTAFVFLLVGLAISGSSLVHAAGPIAWGIVAILLARAVVVYGLLGSSSRVVASIAARRGMRTEDVGGGAFRPLPTSWLHVLFWAGLRGAVSVALALSLPSDLPNRELLQGITFGIVLFTLLVQGTSAPWVVRRSGAAGTAGSSAA
jgi:CPA1 family monovalent cation:H+ antiporter